MTIAFLTFPALLHGSYIVELKNGRQFVVNQHWEEDGMVAFYFHGGIVALPSHLIKTINESDAVVEPLIHLPRATTKKTDGGENILEGSEASVEREAPERIPELEISSEKKASPKATGHNYYRAQRRNLKARLEEATEEFRQASSRRDVEAKRKAIQEITAISKEMLRLSREL
jgi:hypothetical protein